MNTKTSHFSPLDFPEQLRTYIEGATLSDSSSHSGATVLYLDSGYYLNIDQKRRLEREAAIARWFETKGLGTPVIDYLSTDKDYLLTKEASGKDALAFLDQPETICRTMAHALKKLHNLHPHNFPSENHLQTYKDRALKNYEKGEFYAKALLPQFQINSREEAFQLIQKQGHLLKTDAFIHGDACLPNFILKDASRFSCFIDLGLADFSDRHIDLFWAVWSLNYNLDNPKYAELFLDYYGREEVDTNKLRLVAAFEVFG